MKKHYFLVLDVETANSTEDALVYDVGYAVCDRKGNIYEADSFIVSDIFFHEAELMKTAYYATKIPQYLEGIDNKAFKVRSCYQVRDVLKKVIDKYQVEAVCAYNAHFDYTALNTTERWLTKSKYRFFLPLRHKSLLYLAYGLPNNLYAKVVCSLLLRKWIDKSIRQY